MPPDTDPLLVQDCPLRKQKSWIEIRMLGEDDSPVPGMAYRILLPDGKTQEGKLDADGAAKVSDIDPGNCVVSFPDLDSEAWEPI